MIEKTYRFIVSRDLESENLRKERLKKLIDSLKNESIIYAEINTRVTE